MDSSSVSSKLLDGVWWKAPKQKKQPVKTCDYSQDCDNKPLTLCKKLDCKKEFCEIHRKLGVTCILCDDYTCKDCESSKMGVCKVCYNKK